MCYTWSIARCPVPCSVNELSFEHPTQWLVLSPHVGQVSGCVLLGELRCSDQSFWCAAPASRASSGPLAARL